MSLRVLLVDDDDRFRAAACRTLVAEGIEVVAEVDNGLDVLGAAARCRPDDGAADSAPAGLSPG